MSSIAQCIYDIRNYTATEEKVEIIIARLSSAITDVSNTEREIRGSYLVNDNSAVVAERANQLKNELSEIVEFLRGTILPDIDSSRYEVRRLKEYLEEEEDD